MRTGNLITLILAAGEGERMKTISDLPKPLIEVGGLPLFRWALKSLHPFLTDGLLIPENLYLITKPEIKKTLSREGSQIDKILSLENILEVDNSKSPLESLMRGVYELSKSRSDLQNASFLVLDSDHYFRIPSHELFDLLSRENTIGVWTTDKDPSDLSWSFVQKATSTSSRLVEKPKNANFVGLDLTRGVVGVYFFSTIPQSRQDYVNRVNTESLEGDLEHSGYVSSLINELLREGFALTENRIESFVPVGNPAQFAVADQKLKSSIGNHDSPAAFIDFDGTLVLHNSGREEEFSFLNQRVDSVKDAYAKGFKIIIVTARQESESKAIQSALRDAGIRWHQIVYGVGGGPRVLVNDEKPYLEGLPTSAALTVPRNEDTRIDFQVEKLLFPHIQRLQSLEGGSGARVIVYSSDNGKTVRKSSTSPEMNLKLQYQVKWHNFVSELDLPLSGKILVKNQSEIQNAYSLFYYETTLIPELDSVYVSYKEGRLKNPLGDLIFILSELHSRTLTESSVNCDLPIALWQKKVLPALQEIQERIDSEKHRKLCDSLQEVGNLLLNPGERRTKFGGVRALLHGDPTYENIGFARGMYYLLDPIGSLIDPEFMFDENSLGRTYPVFEFSRVFLSHYLRYEMWNSTLLEKLSNSQIRSSIYDFRNLVKKGLKYPIVLDNLEFVILTDIMRIARYKKSTRELDNCVYYAQEFSRLIIE